MDQLPDEVLLEVLQFLPVPDIFQCRLVCKRLNELALMPSVWRSKRLVSAGALQCPVLRLAPCLESLGTDLPVRPYCHSLYTTSCAVRRLALAIRTSSGAVHAAMVIKHQEKLGRLKKLELEIFCKLKSADACFLIETLASTSGLEEIEIEDDDSEKRLLPKMASTMCTFKNTSAVVSTLKDFECSYFPELEHLFGFILTRHAATLECVSYIAVNMGWVVPLLTGLPNLRMLSCSLVPGLAALVACTSLKQLCLEIFDNPSESTIQGAATLLRKSLQLHDVRLHHNEEPSSVDVVAELLLALASSGQSSVEKLSLYQGRSAGDSSGPILQPEAVLRVLPLLPVLRELTLDWRCDDLLRGIVPEAAPNLRSLVLTSKVERCPHSWLHSKTLVSNPSLHVRVSKKHCTSCESCGLGCHQGLHRRLLGSIYVCFFSHPENNCSAPELHQENEYACVYISPDD